MNTSNKMELMKIHSLIGDTWPKTEIILKNKFIYLLCSCVEETQSEMFGQDGVHM